MTHIAAQTSYFNYVLVQGGLVSWFLLALSVGVLAWALMQAFSLRRANLCPPGLYNRLVDPLGDAQPSAARRLCADDPSPLARMVDAGVASLDRGDPPDRVDDQVAQAGAEAWSRWNWRLGYLAVAAAVAPMLGLLGTVVGMIDAFQALGVSQQMTQQSALGSAIGKALITTWMGLVIAIPTLVAHAVLRHRLGLIMLEASNRANALLALLADARKRTPVDR